MSGSSLNYLYSTMAMDLNIPWGHYGLNKDLSYSSNIEEVKEKNPMEDEQISEMMYDICCLLHSLEWYKSGDNCEETYREDLEYFKNKWIKNV